MPPAPVDRGRCPPDPPPGGCSWPWRLVRVTVRVGVAGLGGELDLDGLLGAALFCLGRSIRARWSASVSGGCRMLRGHNPRARTTLSSAPYSVTSALRDSHTISPSTMAKNPYTCWVC